MKRLLKLAEKIENKNLRNKVIDFLKDLRLSSKHFKKYPKEDLKDAGSIFVIPTSGLGPIERDIVNHTVALTELCIKTAENFEKYHGLRLKKDFLIAASILHDLMKVFEYKRDKDANLEPTGIMLDHTMLAVAELYTRDFPEEVIHIVASHYGETGPTPPRTFEAVIFHHLDALSSIIEYYHHGKKKIDQQIILLTREDLKKSGEKTEKLE
ncbi:MAG: HDIG domain-containing protein [Candidatus Aenigmarchaeota archaeon]|nr:HDIG domain-containing protein [Candidatus Aenigmarchaeota archaeon]